jgi:hypothetical protein
MFIVTKPNQIFLVPLGAKHIALPTELQMILGAPVL